MLKALGITAETGRTLMAPIKAFGTIEIENLVSGQPDLAQVVVVTWMKLVALHYVVGGGEYPTPERLSDHSVLL